MILYAPADAPIDAIEMPDPSLSNEEGRRVSMDLFVARDGTQHTYIHKTNDTILNYDFTGVGRGKIVELQQFLKKHAGNEMRLEDHRGDLWRVSLRETELLATMNRRADPVLEDGSFSLSFQGQSYA